MKTYPFPLPRFNARIDHTHYNVLIVDHKWLSLWPHEIERILDGREPAAAWVVSDVYGYAMFPVASGGRAAARALADQLNDIYTQTSTHGAGHDLHRRHRGAQP
jgi:hypothetical protein